MLAMSRLSASLKSRLCPAPRRLATIVKETRCAHCFITFATASELKHHSAHHCFPDQPAEVLRRFPAGTSVLLPHRAVSGFRRGVVNGVASNPRMAHACVSVAHENGVVSDVPISRLIMERPKLLIREVTDSDRTAVASLQTASWVDTYAAAASPEYLAALPRLIDERWSSLAFQPREFALVALDEQAQLGGFVTVFSGMARPLRGSTRTGDHAWVDNMHVALSHRRKGIGRALMAATASRCLSHSYERLRLTVLESNERARSFYESLGGREVARHEVDFIGSLLSAIEIEWCPLQLHKLAFGDEHSEKVP